MLSRVLAQDHLALIDPNLLRAHNLIGAPFCQYPMLMDTALMGEGVASHHRFIWRDLHASNRGQQFTGPVDLPGLDPCFTTEVVPPGMQGHDHFLQRGVPRPLPNAVDGAFHLGGPCLDAGQGVGHRHAQIIVVMNREDHLLRQPLAQMRDYLEHLLRGTVSHRIRQVDGRRSRLSRRTTDFRQKFRVTAGGVLRTEFHIWAEFFGQPHHLHCAGEYLLRGHPELVFHMDRAGGQYQV